MKMLKTLLNKAKKVQGGKTPLKKYDKILMKVEGAKSVFTDTMAQLREANEELVGVRNEAIDKAERLKNIADNAERTIDGNDVMIEKIESLLS